MHLREISVVDIPVINDRLQWGAYRTGILRGRELLHLRNQRIDGQSTISRFVADLAKVQVRTSDHWRTVIHNDDLLRTVGRITRRILKFPKDIGRTHLVIIVQSHPCAEQREQRRINGRDRRWVQDTTPVRTRDSAIHPIQVYQLRSDNRRQCGRMVVRFRIAALLQRQLRRVAWYRITVQSRRILIQHLNGFLTRRDITTAIYHRIGYRTRSCREGNHFLHGDHFRSLSFECLTDGTARLRCECDLDFLHRIRFTTRSIFRRE